MDGCLEKRKQEVYGKWEKVGRQEAGDIEIKITTLHNILTMKKCKETGACLSQNRGGGSE